MPTWCSKAVFTPEQTRTAGAGVRYNSPAMPNIPIDDLVCPVCKQPLTLNAEKETLKCAQCHRAYPIRDEIPVLLVDEAVIED